MRAVFLTLALASAAACSREPPTRFGRIPTTQSASQRAPLLDAGVDFDFRWVRIDESHVGTVRRCSVRHAATRQAATRRVEREYGRDISERVLVACAHDFGATYVDLVFPPEARGFAEQVRVGRVVEAKVLAARGGLEDAPVLEFRSVSDPLTPAVEPPDEPSSIAAGFDFSAARSRPGFVGRVETCSVAWTSEIQKIAREQRERFPAGAQYFCTVACRTATGESRVDVVASQRGAPELLEIRRGARLRLRVLAAAGGAADDPLTALDGNQPISQAIQSGPPQLTPPTPAPRLGAP